MKNEKLAGMKGAKNRPLCFVLMPFGEKKDASGLLIDFDEVYEKLIRPAILEVKMEPIRADEEQIGGLIHKPMFERLLLCDFAVADLTTANANVFYELGIRHAVRPCSTVSIFSSSTRLPFDVEPIRGLPYAMSRNGRPTNVKKGRKELVKRLKAAKKQRAIDSPLFQLVEGMVPQAIAREKTDLFRDQVLYSNDVKEKLAKARKKGVAAVQKVAAGLGDLQDEETGVLIDLFLSYREVKAWREMINLAERMPPPIAKSTLVQEQLAFALNRAGKSDKAERVLRDVIKERGPSSETNGILGRVYKDRWLASKKAGNTVRAEGELRKAIETYLEGFEADWRDAYPGINAVTLMEVSDDPRKEKLIPAVAYAVERRMALRKPDYWDHATLLELYVIRKDQEAAAKALGSALAEVREPWEPESTAGNLAMISEARTHRGEDVRWIKKLEAELLKAAQKKVKPSRPS